MKSYMDDYVDDFLSASEDNFSVLLEKINTLHANVLRDSPTGVPRIPLQEVPCYDKTLTIPYESHDSETVLSELAEAFQGTVRWNQPNALVNITPNPLLDSVAASSIASLYNANCLWDYMSGKITRFERDVVQFLAHIAGWDERQAGGFSTFGGKATLMYALRCGLNRCDRKSVSDGLTGDYVVICGTNAHYSIEDACNYVGIGRSNVVRVAADSSGAMDPVAFESAMRDCLKQNKKIAAIVLLGGDTIQYAVDPIGAVHDICDQLVSEFNLTYTPYMHLDSVVGWIGLAYNSYDFSENPLDIEEAPLEKIRKFTAKLRDVKLVDSFGADFHKTGLAPYASSYFVARSGATIHSVNKGTTDEESLYEYGDVHTHHFTFENSRPASGILSAWTSLMRLGIDGYRRYWAQLLTTSLYITQLVQREFSQEIRVLNDRSLGYAVVIQLIPPGLNVPYEKLHTNEKICTYYTSYAYGLYEYMAHDLLDGRNPYPLLGFIPDFRHPDSLNRCPVFLIYPNHLYFDVNKCRALLASILELKRAFEKNIVQDKQFRIKGRPSHLPR